MIFTWNVLFFVRLQNKHFKNRLWQSGALRPKPITNFFPKWNKIKYFYDAITTNQIKSSPFPELIFILMMLKQHKKSLFTFQFSHRKISRRFFFFLFLWTNKLEKRKIHDAVYLMNTFYVCLREFLVQMILMLRRWWWMMMSGWRVYL